MSARDDLPSGPTSRQRWGLALATLGRALVRLLAIGIVLGLLAVVILWGLPALTRRFIVPLEENRERLERFQASQDEANTRLEQRLGRLQDELGTLEARRGEDARQYTGTIAALQNQLESAQATLAARLDTSQGDLAGVLERLEAFDRSLAGLERSLERLSAAQQAGRESLRSLEEQKTADDLAVETLRREVQALRVMELLIRCRLFLAQSNFGLARQDLQSARDLLAGLLPAAPPYQAGFLAQVLDRLDLALGNLPERPVVAADDLEIAWQLLAEGLPASAATRTPALPGTATASPAFTATLTLTQTDTITATSEITGTLAPAETFTPAPTLGVTIEPTATPIPTLTPIP